jgi:hypothetical protein
VLGLTAIGDGGRDEHGDDVLLRLLAAGDDGIEEKGDIGGDPVVSELLTAAISSGTTIFERCRPINATGSFLEVARSSKVSSFSTAPPSEDSSL